MERRAWWVTAIAGAAALPLVMVLPDGLALELGWVAIALGTLAAAHVGGRSIPASRRDPHRLLTAAIAALVVATSLEVSWWATSLDGPAATAASVMFALSFLLIAAGMVRVVALRMPTGDADGLIDGALVAVATAAVLFDVVSDPAVSGVYSEAGSAALVVLPLLMACVLASLVRVLLTGAHRHPAAWLFLGAASASIVGNILYIAVISTPHDARLRPLWLLGYVLLACAVLHPSWPRLCTPAPPTGRSLAFGRLTVIGVALMSLPATMLRHQEADASRVPAAAAIVCVGLVLWRLARLLLERERAEEELRHRSLHDHLTGLPNRALVCARLDAALDGSPRDDASPVVLFVDLDGFKQVNDTLGHAAGDEVLGVVAERLLAHVRPGDLVGRLAGDEFVVVCETIATDLAADLAGRLLEVLSVPFELDLGEASIGASIGLAWSQPGDDPEALLHRADQAMYRAKHGGKGQVTIWSGEPART